VRLFEKKTMKQLTKERRVKNIEQWEDKKHIVLAPLGEHETQIDSASRTPTI